MKCKQRNKRRTEYRFRKTLHTRSFQRTKILLKMEPETIIKRQDRNIRTRVHRNMKRLVTKNKCHRNLNMQSQIRGRIEKHGRSLFGK